MEVVPGFEIEEATGSSHMEIGSGHRGWQEVVVDYLPVEEARYETEELVAASTAGQMAQGHICSMGELRQEEHYMVTAHVESEVVRSCRIVERENCLVEERTGSQQTKGAVGMLEVAHLSKVKSYEEGQVPWEEVGEV